MKRQNIKPWLLRTIAVASGILSATAADFSWSGTGANSNWTTGANWAGGSAPTAIYPTLYFSGTTRLTNINDLSGAIISAITFNADAGAFTLGGNDISLFGNIINNSVNTQTLGLNIAMTSNRSINAMYGDIVSTSGISGAYNLIKAGTSNFTLRGSNTYTGYTQVNEGRATLDYTGGSSFSTSGLRFGDTTNYLTGNTGTVVVKGAASGTTNLNLSGGIVLANNAMNIVTLNSNGGTSTSITAASLSRSGLSTVNFDISSPNTSISFSSSPTLTNSILSYATVTDATETGFATVVAGQLQRFVLFTGTLPATSGGNFTQNYTTSGTLNMGNNYANIYSLTITDGGALNSTHSGGVQLNALLMQKSATTDYTVNATKIGYTQQLTVHQYSTEGTLIVNSQILNSGATVGLTKAGPGAMRIGAASTSDYSGPTLIQGGSLEVDGSLSKTGTVVVYDGAKLYGNGSIGTAAPTALTVRAGGELSASSSKALGITGTLNMEANSNFEFTLDGGSDYLAVSNAITLNSVNLTLSLMMEPVLFEDVVILSGSSITGAFSTINGQAFGPDNTFQLSYNGTDYDYQLFYNGADISIQALSVPEPSTLVLLGLAFAGLIFLRRTPLATQE